MTIDINNESGVAIDETVLLRLMEYNLAELHVSPDADVAIVLVDEGAMEALHVQWMDEPGPTDVLSFPMDELRPGTEDQPTPAGLLGDIVLCPQVAETQAKDAEHSTVDELVMLTTHGLLHLLGFDHAEPEDEREMFGLQRELITAFRSPSADDRAHDRLPPAGRGGVLLGLRRPDGGDRRRARGDLASRSRRAGRCRAQRGALRRIAADTDAHANAVVFIRILAETTAAVLVTVAFTLLFDEHLVGDARRRGADDRRVVRRRGREPSQHRPHACHGLLRGAAPVIRGVRIILGPLAHGLVVLGNRITPGGTRGSSFASEEQLLSIVDEAA